MHLCIGEHDVWSQDQFTSSENGELRSDGGDILYVDITILDCKQI